MSEYVSHTVLTICRTCRSEGFAPDEEPPGALLGRASARIAAALEDQPVDVRAIACLSACKRSCSAAIAAPGKFSYVVGDLAPEDAADLVAFASAHAASCDGVPPWRARPEKIRKNTIARVPPAAVDHPLVEAVADDVPLGDAD